MATRNAGAAAAAMLSIATATYVSCQKRQERQNEILLTTGEETTKLSRDDYKKYTKATERILDEVRLEIVRSVDTFKASADSAVQDTKLHAVVASRFLDLVTRSAVAMVDYKLHQQGWMGNNDLSAVHERTAASIYEACASHGGVLVKMGQYIATNTSGFLPQAYIDALTPLQDSCAPLSVEQVEEMLEQELRKIYGKQPAGNEPLWKDVFLEIDPVPLGSASLAQVHAATLLDGRRVALKVQRPNLDVTTRSDMLALNLLSRAVERAFPGSGFDWML